MIVKDRLVDLQESIYSYHRYLRTPFEIIIHDEGSTYPPMLQYLQSLEDMGVPVYRVRPRTPDTSIEKVTDSVARTVAAYLEKSKSDVYVVTDPDVALDSAPPNLLLVYETLLTSLNITCVGASLRWDDWPEQIQAMGF